MAHVLLAWIGMTDLKGFDSDGSGPIAQAVGAREFDHVVLLNNMANERLAPYEKWLKKQTDASVVVRPCKLSSPTHHGDIYAAVIETLSWARKEYGERAKLTFHLSPGTPAMASIWIIVAKTQFDAELIESSKEQGVAPVDIPFELAAEFIPAAVERANADLARIAEGSRPEEPKFGDILHRSEVMKQLVRRARQAAPFDEAILIEGESGTGKQLLAEAIHRESPRQGKPFVEVNCGAIPRELFESSFFGHTKGAFTGADRAQKGYFEEANDGTLFLDEIGELPLDQQVKLLRALQQKKVRPLNAKQDVPVRVRVIAATNRKLLEEVRAGRFREDLYYRLAVLMLKIPFLREREGDVGHLIDGLLERLNGELGSRPGAAQKKLSPKGRNILLRHRWPGNVRELEAALRRAFVWSKSGSLEEADIRDALLATPETAATEILGQPLGNGFDLDGLLDDVARHYFERAMKESGKKLQRASDLLGIRNYQTLKNRLDKLGIER